MRAARTLRGRQLAPHVCRACACPLVQPQSAESHGHDWHVVLRCPNCGWAGEELLDQETADRFDDEIERGTDHLLALLAVVTELNMRQYADRFAAALQADAILPEDF